jgi:hypothetical protein
VDRYQIYPGGGYPPSPVPTVVEIEGKKYEAVIVGTHVQIPPSVALNRRHRSYWYMEME